MNESNYANSSVEHAETRAVRIGNVRLNRNRYREHGGDSGYSDLFDGCTLYTTLESCTQCVGVMHLAGIDEVVYGQRDALQQGIGDTIYKLHADGPLPAPHPVRADFFPLYERLENEFIDYKKDASQHGGSLGTTAYLSSIYAYRVFSESQKILSDFKVENAQNIWHKENSLHLFKVLSDPALKNVVG